MIDQFRWLINASDDWSSNAGSGIAIAPSGTKPLPEPMLTLFHAAKWGHQATMSKSHANLFYVTINSFDTKSSDTQCYMPLDGHGHQLYLGLFFYVIFKIGDVIFFNYEKSILSAAWRQQILSHRHGIPHTKQIWHALYIMKI